MQILHGDVLTPQDVMSITALIEQLAAEKKFQRENCYFLLEAEFNVSDARLIKRSDYGRAVKLLVDLQDITVH